MPDPLNPSYADGPDFTGKKTKAPGDQYLDQNTGKLLKLDKDYRGDPLDSPMARRIFDRAMGWYVHELDRQSDNRMEMAIDDDFYDHIQYSGDELATLKERGQAPIVFNLTQTTVNWVLGTQRRAASDYRILPRKKEGAKAAQVKTDLLKHISDENRSSYEMAEAFAMAVRVGLGWLECGQGRPEEGTQVYDRHEDWRCMLWDSTSRRYDMLDARYQFRTKWLDADVATNLWQRRQGVIAQAMSGTSYGLSFSDGLGDDPMDSIESEHFNVAGGLGRTRRFGESRDRVRVVEAWFKLSVPDALVIKGGQFNGELFDEWSPGHWADVKNEIATVIARPREVIHCAIMTDAGLLDLRQSPYRHNRYPFTPVWGYRRRRDGMPYGMIRGIRDVQRDLNKRGSKALHILSTTRVTLEEGAVEDIEVLRNEAARPDAVIEYKNGHQPPQIHTDSNLAAAHTQLMERDAQMIQSIGGVTDENLGRRTNATSGIAIERRQDQGALATSIFFENFRQSRQIHGEKLMVLIEMYYDQEEEFRITDSRGNPDFKTINDANPDNAIANHKADFVISEEDWRATVRQANAESLLELAKQLASTAPQIVVQILDLVVEALDVPKRDEIVKRIRAITNVPDPDADPNNPDPETQAANAAKQQQADMMDRQAKAALAELEGKARKINAEAAKVEKGLASDEIAQLQAAFETAFQIAGAPAVIAAADQILNEARAAAQPTSQQPAMQQPSPAPQPAPQMPPADPAMMPMADPANQPMM
ncbi:MAG: hypothetical protein Q8K33_01560 [Cypionkella sp.]|uniref:portal protein n=1 Tax=Cypionkella sp. TaxID=2811411 RepID=UPI002731A654|nr:hypothetical protein [Cypionkella sp.]MDP2047568.1 hypothetical protein [Cypionkella sp.]